MLHVQPGARRTAFVGFHGDRIKAAVAAPPVGGKANRQVEKLLASVCGCPARDVSVSSGQSSRQKRVEISGLSESVVRQKIVTAINS